MNLFRKKVAAPAVPQDPNGRVVEEIKRGYPYGAEAFGMRSIIRIAVYTVLEMKKRGLI